MANSRSAYMAKKAIATAGPTNVTFTPPHGVHTWQFRFITNDDTQLELDVQTKDEDGDLIHIDDSPFVRGTSGDIFDTNGDLEITLDSTNPSVKVTCRGDGATATIKCKAYRTIDDVSGGAYSTTLGIS